MQVAPPVPWKLFCHFLFFEIKGMVYIINYKHQEGYIQNYLHVNYDVNKVPKTLHRILMTHNKKNIWNHLSLTLLKSSSIPSKVFLFVSLHVTQNIAREIRLTCFFRPLIPFQT